MAGLSARRSTPLAVFGVKDASIAYGVDLLRIVGMECDAGDGLNRRDVEPLPAGALGASGLLVNDGNSEEQNQA